MKYCPFCGSGLQEDMVFCPKCGKRFLDGFENPESIEPERIELHHIDSTEPAPTSVVVVLESEPAAEEPVAEPEGSTVVETTKQPAKKKSKKIVWLVVAVLLVALGAGGFFGIREAMKSASITDMVNSVLYLEICDDTDSVIGTASGFIIEDGTTLVTNYHVIDGAHHITAYTPDGANSVKIHTILAYDEEADLAVLKCEDNIGVPPLLLGDSDAVEQGDEVFAVGYPLGVANTLSDGVVSSRYLDEANVDVLQVTAAISSGSSGGALFNNAGQVIGVIRASYIDGQNLNIAIAVNELKQLMATKREPVLMEEYYAAQSQIGKNSFNLAQGFGLVKAGDYYFYSKGLKIFCYNGETKTTKQIAQGQHVNAYKGRLYYYDRKSHAVFSCKFDGTDVEKMILAPNVLKEPMGMSDMLIANGLVFFTTFNSNNYTTDLYIYDVTTWKNIDFIEDVCNFSYHGNNLYIACRGGGIAEVNMLTFETQLFETSCSPWIRGISADGKVYYISEDSLLDGGFYYIDPNVGVEVRNSNYARKSGNGRGWDIWVIENTVYLAMRSNGTYSTYRIEGNGDLRLINDDIMMTDGGYLPELNYYYSYDGTTVNMDTGNVIGTWIFK